MDGRLAGEHVLMAREDDAIARNCRREALSKLTLPRHRARSRVEGVHARLLRDHQIARAAWIAPREVAEGCRAEKAGAIKCRAAKEASGTASEDDLGRPIGRAVREIEQIESAVFPAD